MARIIIVDDDPVRQGRIKNLLLTNFALHDSDIHSSSSINEAKLNLKRITYSIVFLDMALPLYCDSKETDLWGGVKILKDIQKGRLEAPERIIGYTALKDDLDKKEKEFKDIGFSLDCAKAGDLSWLSDKVDSIKYCLHRSTKHRKTEKDFAVLTVHGIRTFGSWQEYLFEKVKVSTGAKDIEHLPFKFTSIDFLTFMVPVLRRKVVERLKTDLRMWLRENRAKEIHCFSHSFGTYIIIKALEEMAGEPGIDSIKTIVLSGSVLNKNYDFSKLKYLTNAKIINDCAVNDAALIFSEALVVGTGMAGVTGFRGLSNDRIQNRYFNGGHSMFFDRNFDFIDKYWLPIFNNEIKSNNKEVYIGFINEVFIYLARASSKIKMIYPIALFTFILYKAI